MRTLDSSAPIRESYSPPSAETIEIKTELGFAASPVTTDTAPDFTFQNL